MGRKRQIMDKNFSEVYCRGNAKFEGYLYTEFDHTGEADTKIVLRYENENVILQPKIVGFKKNRWCINTS